MLKRLQDRDCAGATPPLDGYTYLTSAGHFSCARRLFTSATSNPAIRVRRASDDAELDIYLLGPGIGYLDIAALSAFCAGTNGFIKTWYDHTRNARHATQTTNAAQAKIYDSSTGVLCENGIPHATFDGVDDNYTWTPGLTVATSPALSMHSVNKPTNQGCNWKVGGNGAGGQVWRYFPGTLPQLNMDYNTGSFNLFDDIRNPSTRTGAYSWSKPLNANLTATTMRQDFTNLAVNGSHGSLTFSLNTNAAMMGGSQNGSGGFQLPWAGAMSCWLLVQNTLNADEQRAVDTCLAQHLAI